MTSVTTNDTDRGGRWYQISLRTVLVALVVIALAVVAANERLQRVWLQGEVERLQQEAGSRYIDTLHRPATP